MSSLAQAQPLPQPSPLSRVRRVSRSSDCEPIRGKRILYIDDEPLMRHAANRLLRYAGADPLLAESHEKAISLAASEPGLSVAILDYRMPDGCVCRLIERLRFVRPLLTLIGTSGAPRLDDFEVHGVHHFLPKPWHLRDLIDIVGLVCPAAPRPVRVALPGDP